MLLSSCHLYLERYDPAGNMQRFYRLSVQPTLFGDIAVVREWGRIGTSGQRMTRCFSMETQALSELLAVARSKLARGYRPGYRGASSEICKAEAFRTQQHSNRDDGRRMGMYAYQNAMATGDHLSRQQQHSASGFTLS